MSKVKIEGNASGTGTLTIAAPNTNTDRTLTLPDGAGEILTDAGVPASAMPSGSVLQVKQTIFTGTASTTSASFVFPADLTLSITPSSATSKILCQCSIWVSSNRWLSQVTLQRDGTDIGLADAAGSRSRYFLNWNMDYTVLNTHGHLANVNGNLLDSPNTTNAVTYRIGHKRRPDNEGGDAYSRINYSAPDRNNSSYDHRHVSTLTLMEIAG